MVILDPCGPVAIGNTVMHFAILPTGQLALGAKLRDGTIGAWMPITVEIEVDT